MVKDYIAMGIAYFAVGLLYTIGLPFIIVAGIYTYIDKLWSN